jgi:hypothetical protein
MPGFKELRCPHAVAKPCALSGSNLFLATAIASTPTFDNPTDVPPDFTGTQLVVPHPSSGTLYLKLRDDPGTVQTLTLPVLPISAAAMTPLRIPEAVPETPTEPSAQPKPESPPTPTPATPQSQSQSATAPAGTHS